MVILLINLNVPKWDINLSSMDIIVPGDGMVPDNAKPPAVTVLTEKLDFFFQISVIIDESVWLIKWLVIELVIQIL